jgi:hypothetical protein
LTTEKLDHELEKRIRESINPVYVGTRGTNSHERSALIGEIDRLRVALKNEQDKDIHSCHPNCVRNGCVNRRLRGQLAELLKLLDKKL